MHWLTKSVTRIVALAVVLAMVGAGAWFYTAVVPLGSPGREVVVVVTSGESVDQLASELAAKGVIPSAFALRLDFAVFGSVKLIAGTYQIRLNSPASAVRDVFSHDPNAREIDVEPGLTLAEVATQVEVNEGSSYATRFRADLRRTAAAGPFHPGENPEGLIGPGTYVIGPHESPTTLATAMQTGFITELAREGITPTTHLFGLDAYQLIIAASIVQKEGYYNRNMTRVARVILNRLARGGGLQMDATILYYFHQDGGAVTPAMLAVHTPYNTYLNSGLTPTPICTPSAYALWSMAHPASGGWLYFTLVTRSGTLAFATTFAQQLRNEHLAASRGIT
jgi:UPF0755 protein